MFLEKLNKQLLAAIEEAGFETPTKLQKKAISRIKGGKDLLFVAPSNAGKSTSIAISVIEHLKHAFEDAPRALIIVPGREEALYMQKQFEIFGAHTDLRVQAAFERKIEDKKEDIYEGVDIVIGTGGILGKLYTHTGLNLNKIKMFIVDDVSLIFKIETPANVYRLADSIPKCQQIAFSEVLNEKVENFVEKFFINPDIIEIIEE